MSFSLSPAFLCNVEAIAKLFVSSTLSLLTWRILRLIELTPLVIKSRYLVRDRALIKQNKSLTGRYVVTRPWITNEEAFLFFLRNEFYQVHVKRIRFTKIS